MGGSICHPSPLFIKDVINNFRVRFIYGAKIFLNIDFSHPHGFVDVIQGSMDYILVYFKVISCYSSP